MAFLFGDTFDHLAIADRFMKWTTEYSINIGTVAFSAGNGRRGTSSFRFSNTSTGSSNAPKPQGVSVPASGTTAIAQFSWRQVNGTFADLGQSIVDDPESAVSVNSLLYVRSGATTQVWFHINDDGTISAYRGTTLLGTTSSGLALGTTHYLQFKVVIHDTTGTVTIKIDGIEVLALTGQDTRNGTPTGWTSAIIGQHSSATTNTHWDYDDFILLDGSGSFNNDLLPDQRGDVLLPNAVGNSNMSTPSGGAVDRYTMVDETTLSETDYNTFAAVNDKDTYGYQNCPVGGATVNAFQINMAVKKEDAGTALVKSVFRTGGVDYDGTDKPVPVDTRYAIQVYDRSPVDGTTALSTALLDGAEIGLKKSA